MFITYYRWRDYRPTTVQVPAVRDYFSARKLDRRRFRRHALEPFDRPTVVQLPPVHDYRSARRFDRRRMFRHAIDWPHLSPADLPTPLAPSAVRDYPSARKFGFLLRLRKRVALNPFPMPPLDTTFLTSPTIPTAFDYHSARRFWPQRRRRVPQREIARPEETFPVVLPLGRRREESRGRSLRAARLRFRPARAVPQTETLYVAPAARSVLARRSRQIPRQRLRRGQARFWSPLYSPVASGARYCRASMELTYQCTVSMTPTWACELSIAPGS